jgi:hypothetical protein
MIQWVSVSRRWRFFGSSCGELDGKTDTSLASGERYDFALDQRFRKVALRQTPTTLQFHAPREARYVSDR